MAAYDCLLMGFVFLGHILLRTTFPNSVAFKLLHAAHSSSYFVLPVLMLRFK